MRPIIDFFHRLVHVWREARRGPTRTTGKVVIHTDNLSEAVRTIPDIVSHKVVVKVGPDDE